MKIPIGSKKTPAPCPSPQNSMQRVEHLAAQRIANLRVQKPEDAPFLPSENRFFRPSRACVFVPAKLAVLTKMCKRRIRGHYRFV